MTYMYTDQTTPSPSLFLSLELHGPLFIADGMHYYFCILRILQHNQLQEREKVKMRLCTCVCSCTLVCVPVHGFEGDKYGCT